MSIQQNFPAISPSLNLNFARSKTLDPRITFSRTTTATRVNEQGLIEVVSADTPRFDHEYDASTGVVKSLGLLVEEQRTNFMLNSNLPTGFETGGQSTITVSNVSGIITPDGQSSTVKRLQYATNASYRFGNLSSGTAGLSYTGSVWIRAVSGSAYITLDVNDRGVIGYTIGEEWQRVSTTGSRDDFNYRFFDLTGANQDIYIWGVQLEEGAFPTSYIPTSGSTATRNPDNVSMTGDNFSDWYNQEQGSIVWIGRVYTKEDPAVCAFRINRTDGGNLRGMAMQIDTRYSINNNTITFASRTQSSNIPAKVAPVGILTSTSTLKLAGGYIESVGLSTIRAAFNGLPEDSYSGSSQTDITYDTMYEIEIMGNRGISGTDNQFTGVCEQLVYYPRILTDAQLQSLTK